jgi:hypothetical protein
MATCQKIKLKPNIVAYTYNASYLGDKRITRSRPAQAKLARPISEIKYKNKRAGSMA